jgi:capsule biosynthesis phosphatase
VSKTIIMDLDGTLCTQTRGGDLYFTDAKPLKEMIDRLREYKKLGWTVVIQTARGMNLYAGDMRRIEYNMRLKTEKWLKENDVPFDALYFGKVAGDRYVDDKGWSMQEFLTRDID